MIKMFNKLPLFIYINNNKYFINTDFRNMILFEEKMQDIENMTKDERIDVVFNTLYKFCPAFFKSNHTSKELKILHKKFLWFYQCGRKNYHIVTSSQCGINNIFSYQYDDEYIYGAFLEQYNIDLTIDRVHWWKYKACLSSLKKDTRIEEIKSYRAYSGKDKDMIALKTYWTLPLKTKEQEQLDKTADWLMKYNKN